METAVASTSPVEMRASAHTLLVIEDDYYVRSLLHDIFGPEGYHVMEARDGPTGLALARQERPDCVVLDIALPALSGFDVLEQLTHDPTTREIPIVMLTAATDTPSMDRAFRAGAVDFLCKPAEPARLIIRVRGAIERRRLLQELQALRANFTAMLVHDLRSPVSVISAYVDILASGDDGPVSPEQRKDLESIGTSCSQMTALIGEMLDLSKLEAGKKLQLRLQSFDLGVLVTDVCRRFAGAAAQRQIRLTRMEPPGTCVMVGDARRLDRVLMNLLSNAMKFTPRGGRVEVALCTGPSEVEFSVSDSGPGIPLDELPLLFELFSQTSSSLTTASPGSGLGLAICRHLVEAHGGHVAVESSPGHGSRFIVKLPRTPDDRPTPRRMEGAERA
jgi:signal transduction histidine kinase